MFADADLHSDPDTELDTLIDLDQAGEYDFDEKTGDFTFYTESGYYYEQGHGRDKCSRVKCCTKTRPDTPFNCGFKGGQWHYPDGFKSCGDKCAGAFCRCIRNRGRYKDLKLSNI